MRQRPGTKQGPGEKTVKDIRRATRKQYSAEEQNRIVLDGLKAEDSISELCRREARDLKEVVAEQALELRLLKESMIGPSRQNAKHSPAG